MIRFTDSSRPIPALSLLSVCALALVGVTPLFASDDADTAPAIDSEEMMRRWQEATTPGKGHEFLERFVGSWDYTSKVWMGGPESEPMQSSGTSENRWILDGHYLEQDATGTMMGRPFTGLGITGYDNYKQKYVSMLIDSMSTAIYTMEGFLDRTGAVLTTYGTMDEYVTGEHDKMVRYVTTWVDDDHHTFEVYDLHGGIDFKVMELAYTRRK
jgi:hypothetical protein